MWEFEQPDAPGTGNDVSPKQKLMSWINEKLPPELPITNFISDWNDGRAIGALVDACAPGMNTVILESSCMIYFIHVGHLENVLSFFFFVIGLYPDWKDRDTKYAFENAKEAMDLAEEWLGIPQLIRPNEMVNPKVDEQSMMTYLSLYPSAKLRPGAPIRPKTNSARVRCYGKGSYIK